MRPFRDSSNILPHITRTRNRLSCNPCYGSPHIHADETTISIKGADYYVWVFTDGTHVVFKLTETREAKIVHELLSSYTGVLISDFFPGYDALQCQQQKCWVHLIRDLNDDLWKSPWDREFENFIVEVRSLIVPIIATTDTYGLKRRHLQKFKRHVEAFYKQSITSKTYRSELVNTYQKRFIRYQESLFTFLDHDGVPWHNNKAENAIRHIARQRTISGSFFESSTHAYLRLLGIRQSCRFQGKPFLKFLLSEEKDLDTFKVPRRLKHTREAYAVALLARLCCRRGFSHHTPFGRDTTDLLLNRMHVDGLRMPKPGAAVEHVVS